MIRRHLLLLLLLLPACSGGSPALWDQDPAGYLNGWARSVDTPPFSYHSPHPDVHTSLLTRATDGKMRITWETDPVPPDFAAGSATFIWMGGLDRRARTHRFTLSIDGRDVLVFRSVKDGQGEAWEEQGTGGIRLGFRSVLVDRYDDLMGYFYLQVPAARLTPGRPLRLSVVGEAADDPDWYMTFEHPVRPGARLQPEPALIRVEGRTDRLVRVEVEHLGGPVTARVRVAGRDRETFPLERGFNYRHVAVPDGQGRARVPLEVVLPGQATLRDTLDLEPVRRFELHLLHHSHVDIGYTHTQDKVARIQRDNLALALDLADRTRDYPEPARFRWNTEVLWPVEQFLAEAGSADRERLFDAVRRGQIGLDALYANTLTGLERPEELFRLLEPARRLGAEIGRPLTGAMITDIPGYTWGLVPAMVQSGVRYFSIGPNAGHRIGSFLAELGDVPFWWVSPSGRERLLCWVAGKSYSWFHTGLGHTGPVNTVEAVPLLGYLRELEAAGWPYGIASFRYNIGSDNGPPDPQVADFVRAWNERFETPTLVMDTTEGLLAAFAERYGDALPSHRGDLTGYWEDGAASSARETAANRAAADRLTQAETLRAMTAPERFPATAFRAAWRDVLLFSEHTWGSWDSISNPDGPFSVRQWEIKQAFADSAEARSRRLREDALADWPGRVPPGERITAVDVVNTCGWPRTDLVRLPAGWALAGEAAFGPDGSPLPTQRLSTGELAVRVGEVPPFGSLRITLREGAPARVSPVVAEGYELRTPKARIRLDATRGTIAEWDQEGVGWVDRGAWAGLADYRYVAGRDPAGARSAGWSGGGPVERGPLVASLRLETGEGEPVPGARHLTLEVTAVAGLDRLEIACTVDKTRRYTPEGVHLVFPFQVPGGTVRIDAAWGWYRPGEDQVPGANRNYFPVTRWVDLSSAVRGVTLVPVDAPLIELGRISTDATRVGWLEEVPATGTVISYLMNNYWETNYRAWQEGPVTFRYRVVLHQGGFDPAQAFRSAAEAAQPLRVVPVAATAPVRGALLTVSPAEVLVTLLKPAETGPGLVLRLFNASEREVAARVTPGRDRREWELFRSDPAEGMDGERVTGPLRLPPAGIVTLRLVPPG